MSDTVANIVNDAAVELGLGTVSDVFASTDANIVQMRTLLASVCADLVRAYPWSVLQTEYTFSTVASTASYALPAGFDRFLPDTHWDRTAQWPIQPITPGGWQTVQAWSSSSLVWLAARLLGSNFKLTPTPSSVKTIAFEYVSKYWASATGGTAPTRDTISVNSDIIYFDRTLVMRGLKLAFRQAKGFDTTTLQDDFDARLESSKNADTFASTITLGGKEGSFYLGNKNLSPGNW